MNSWTCIGACIGSVVGGVADSSGGQSWVVLERSDHSRLSKSSEKHVFFIEKVNGRSFCEAFISIYLKK